MGSPPPSSCRRPSRASSGSRTPARGRASLATQSWGFGSPFHPGQGWRKRGPGKREGGLEPRGSQSGRGLRRRQPSWLGLRRPRAPVRAAPAALFGTARNSLSSPYPPATGVGAARSARATRGHGQLRAVETGVDREEDGAELQPRGHGLALAQPGPTPRPGSPPQASPEWAVAPAAAAAAQRAAPPSMRHQPTPRPDSLVLAPPL